jgi:predicted nuclease of predicted toxin-antitoxin system
MLCNIKVSYDDKFIIICEGRSFQVLDSRTFERVRFIEQVGIADALNYEIEFVSSQENLIMVYKDMRIYDFKNKPVVYTNPFRMVQEINRVKLFQILRDENKYIVFAERYVTLWNLKTHKLLKTIELGDDLCEISLSIDQRFFAIYSFAVKRLVVYNLKFQKIREVTFLSNCSFGYKMKPIKFSFTRYGILRER